MQRVKCIFCIVKANNVKDDVRKSACPQVQKKQQDKVEQSSFDIQMLNAKNLSKSRFYFDMITHSKKYNHEKHQVSTTCTVFCTFRP